MSSDTRIRLEASGEKQFGPCACCGEMTKRIWGFAYSDEVALAAYFVDWNPKHEPMEAAFDLILGDWGDHKTAEDRSAVSLTFRQTKTGPAFMVIDAEERPVAKSPLISRSRSREEVLASHELCTVIFALCDAIYLDEPRLTFLSMPMV